MKERVFIVSVGDSRESKKWKRTNYKWPDFVQRCTQTQRTKETAVEYACMSKDNQGKIKDVGGFVAGSLNGERRKKENVTSRSMLTLDLDFVSMPAADLWDEIDTAFNYTALMYSSHSHTPEKPRLRLVIPLSRDISPAEYEPIARKIAEQIGINQFDDSTYETARLMYWPSTSSDAEFYSNSKDGELLNPDRILKLYDDWQDVSSWPRSNREGDIVAKREIKKVGDPREKYDGDGKIIGAFCRAYSIEDAIETFLSDVYKPGTKDRYSYKLGESTNGVVCYDGLFAYSHHGTDPAGGQLCNAFDLVRIHKFGSQDVGSRAEDTTRLPSYKSMLDFAANNGKVKIALLQSAGDDFADIDFTADNQQWKTKLEFGKKNELKPTVYNFRLILENDPELRGKFWVNELSQYIEAGLLPWRDIPGQWIDADDANLRGYMEEKYQLSGKDKLADAFTIVALKNKRHPVKEYLKPLQWDGRRRLDTIIISLLGARDTELNRAITRKHFVAAVARIYQPGIKYDTCLTLTGPEETGKSSLFRIMGGAWFDDSITTIEGKEGRENLRGKWIIELAELNSIKRSEVASVKNFLSNQKDSYRAAYDRRVTPYPRQCIFCGTTNEDKFLKGDTGNRRFWVIQIIPELSTGGTLPDRLGRLEQLRDQLWAEAKHYYEQGEKLYLNEELGAALRSTQVDFSDETDDPMKALLQQFLDTKLPTDWSVWDLYRRRAYFNNPDPLDAEGVVVRERFCIPEFLCEKMEMKMSDKEYKYKARKIGKLMAEFSEWENTAKNSRHVEKLYGVQKYYKKKADNDNKECDTV